MQRVGLGIAVANAASPMADYADYVTQRPAGNGAVREVCDLLLKACNKWTVILNQYLNP